MLELTVLGSVLRGISVLYWLLAISALGVVLWKLKGRLRPVSYTHLTLPTILRV